MQKQALARLQPSKVSGFSWLTVPKEDINLGITDLVIGELMYNLRQELKGKYKITCDPAVDSVSDPHMHVIEGKHADVYYHGEKSGVVLLGIDIHDNLSSIRHNKLVSLLVSINAIQHNAYIYLIQPEQLDTLSKPLGLPRVRKLSPEHRAKLAKAGKQHLFVRNAHGSKASTRTPNKPLEGIR